MAEENTENRSKPGVGMRMTISMISKKFSKAENISTNTLSDWMRNEDEAQKLVLLVGIVDSYISSSCRNLLYSRSMIIVNMLSFHR